MEKLLFLLERIYRITYIPINLIDKSGEINILSQGYEILQNPFICDEYLKQNIINRLGIDDSPILQFEDEFLYGACKDLMGNYVILGPVSRNKIGAMQTRKYAHTHHIAESSFQIIFKPLRELNAALSTIYLMITGKYMDEVAAMTNPDEQTPFSNKAHSTYQNYKLDTDEQDAPRYNFSVEMDFVSHIRNGDPHNAKKQISANISSFNEESVGKLARKSFKQNEYMACTVIILASRAAIDGGVDSLTAYLISDLYLQRLEKCHEIAEIFHLLPEIIIGYAEVVQKYKQEHSKISHVAQCKNYIANHLTKRFTIDDIADEIGVNKAHLSRRFSKTEGMGIQQYARQKRIDAAANMLKFSDESILSISNYLCFTSQSHFGKVFKECIGQTPQKYRDQNKLIDFI